MIYYMFRKISICGKYFIADGYFFQKLCLSLLTYTDEFHHSVNDQYQRIVEYFKPQFLLGLTATPERMDGKNIYEICDYNVPYEISLKEAINKGMLSPFHYYGIYDDTDYSSLHLVQNVHLDSVVPGYMRRRWQRNFVEGGFLLQRSIVMRMESSP